MFLCSLTDELCTKEENDKTGCKLNFGHECISKIQFNNRSRSVASFLYRLIFMKLLSILQIISGLNFEF